MMFTSVISRVELTHSSLEAPNINILRSLLYPRLILRSYSSFFMYYLCSIVWYKYEKTHKKIFIDKTRKIGLYKAEIFSFTGNIFGLKGLY